MLHGNELKETQEDVGVTDEEIAARAKMSKTTLRRAMANDVPEDTKRSVMESLESLGRERIHRIEKRLTRLRAQVAG